MNVAASSWSRSAGHPITNAGPANPTTHTTRPIVTGASILGIVYDGGVMMAADTQLSYGSMAKTMGISRLVEIDGTLVGASGEYSDFQAIQDTLKAKCLEFKTGLLHQDDDGSDAMTARSMWNYLRVVMYNRRNKMSPLWNDVVLSGKDGKGKYFLGTVDKLGSTIEETMIATGFGAYLAMPLMRERWVPDMDEGEARALLEDCMKILHYRDCRASNRIILAKVSEEGVLISDPYELETDWTGAAEI